MNKSLYHISQEAMEIVSLIEETGELTPELEQYLTTNQSELTNKAINVANFVRSLGNDVTILDEEIKRLQGLKKAKLDTAQKLKDAIVTAMAIYNLEKLSSPTLNLSIRRSEAVEVLGNLDSHYMTEKVTYTPDKVRIKNAIKQGENVEGAILKENYSLQIK